MHNIIPWIVLFGVTTAAVTIGMILSSIFMDNYYLWQIEHMGDVFVQ